MRIEQELRQVERIIFEHCNDCKVYTGDFFSVSFGSNQLFPVDSSTIYKGEYIQALHGNIYPNHIYICGSISLGYINKIENDLRNKLRRYWAGGEKL